MACILSQLPITTSCKPPTAARQSAFPVHALHARVSLSEPASNTPPTMSAFEQGALPSGLSQKDAKKGGFKKFTSKVSGAPRSDQNFEWHRDAIPVSTPPPPSCLPTCRWGAPSASAPAPTASPRLPAAAASRATQSAPPPPQASPAARRPARPPPPAPATPRTQPSPPSTTPTRPPTSASWRPCRRSARRCRRPTQICRPSWMRRWRRCGRSPVAPAWQRTASPPPAR